MRLIKCYIDGFGKLKDMEYNFEEGLNCFVRKNGWGKSTFAAFIRIMFYGFEGESKRNLLENERKYYKPWTGDVYGGEIRFEAGGKIYNLQRTFGSKKSEDKSALYDGETNMQISDMSDNIGEEIFQLDAASFRRTVYIGQNECDTWTTDGINAKIGNIDSDISDINNYDKACAELKAVVNTKSPTKKTGELYKRKQELSVLKERVRRSENVERQIELLRTRKEQIEKMRSEAADYQHSISEREKAAAFFRGSIPDEYELNMKIEKAREYEKMRARFDAVKMTEEDYAVYTGIVKTYFPDRDLTSEDIQLPSDMELDTCIFIWNEIKQNRQEMDRLERQLESMEHSKPYEKDDKTDDNNSPKEKRHGCMLLIVGAILVLVLSLIFKVKGTIGTYQMFFGIMISVVALVAGIIIHLKYSDVEKTTSVSSGHKYRDGDSSGKEYKIHNDIIELIDLDKREIDDNIVKLKVIIDKYGIHTHFDRFDDDVVKLRKLIELQRLQKNMRNTGMECESVKREISTYIEQLGFEAGDDLFSQLIEIQRRLEDYKVRCNAVHGMTDRATSKTSVDNKDIYENMDSRLAECEVELADLTAELNEIRNTALQLEQKQPEFDRDIVKYELISRTYDLLGKAKEKFTARYTEPVMEAFMSYYSQINDAHTDMQIDADMNISYKDHGMYRDKHTLSAGLKDLTDICARAALVEVMYKGEKPMLIMDDPFVNMDDKNMEGAVRLMSILSKKYQIIYFTCSQNRVL